MSREIKAPLAAWQIARTAAVEMGLSHEAEMRLRAMLETVRIVFVVEPNGSAIVAGAECVLRVDGELRHVAIKGKVTT